MYKSINNQIKCEKYNYTKQLNNKNVLILNTKVFFKAFVKIPCLKY